MGTQHGRERDFGLGLARRGHSPLATCPKSRYRQSCGT